MNQEADVRKGLAKVSVDHTGDIAYLKSEILKIKALYLKALELEPVKAKLLEKISLKEFYLHT